MDCETCKKDREQETGSVSRWTHEADMARMERTIKRLWILLIIMLILLAGTNAAWILYESQFLNESVAQEVDTGDGSAYVSGIGDVFYYGESEASD